MTHHELIVARMAPGSAPDIAKLFGESDRGELPRLIGVTRRRLFQFDDIYMHLIESDRDPGAAIQQAVKHPEFRDISEKLTSYVRAYDPETWRSPKDAMANCFYRWDRDAQE